MKKIFIICILAVTSFATASAQKRPIDTAFELQWYPAGIIPALKAEIGLGDYHKHSLEVRIAMNRTRRNDWGKHGDERGIGFGGGLGYKYYITKPMTGIFISGRLDVWRLNIDHRELGADGQFDTDDDFNLGNTKITVLQPTGLIGYKFNVPMNGQKDKFFITPHVAGGWEINVQTEGENVGEGRIILFGLDLAVRL